MELLDTVRIIECLQPRIIKMEDDWKAEYLDFEYIQAFVAQELNRLSKRTISYPLENNDTIRSYHIMSSYIFDDYDNYCFEITGNLIFLHVTYKAQIFTAQKRRTNTF